MSAPHWRLITTPVMNRDMARWLAQVIPRGISAMAADGITVPTSVVEFAEILGDWTRDREHHDNMPHPDAEYEPVAVAAARAEVTPQAVYQWVEIKRVGCIHVGGRRHVNVDDVDRVIAERSGFK